MLKIPDSGPFQRQSQPQPQTPQDIAIGTIFRIRGNIVDTIMKKRLSS